MEEFDERCRKRVLGGMAWPTRSVIASELSIPYSGRDVKPMGSCGGSKGAAISNGLQNHTYALADRQNLKSSPDVVTRT